MVDTSLVWGANKISEPVDIKEEEQETPPSTVWGPSKVKNPPIKVNDQDMYLYDGDTLINKITGERLRLRGYDAAEVSRIGKNNEFHLGTPAGETMTHEINKIIREMGFDRLVDSGEKGSYDRRLVDLANSQGMLLSDYLHQERVVKGSRWMTREQEMLRSFGSVADFINRTSNNISPGDRARGIVESVMGDSRLRPTFGTTQEVFKGSGYAVNHYQSVINNLNTVIKNTKDRSLKKQLQEELQKNTDALTYHVNETPGALWLGPAFAKGDRNTKVGMWGELWNSGEKSFFMLENTAAGFTSWLGDLVDNDTMKEWGDEWIVETEGDLRNAGYTTDMWSVNNPLDAGRFFANTVVQYGPQLGLIWGSAKVGAAAGFAVGGPVGSAVGGFIGGTGSALIMALSSVYQDQPEAEKDPLVALGISIPIALVDRLGLTRALPDGTNVFTKSGKDKVLEAIKETQESTLGRELTKPELEYILNKNTIEILKDAGMSLEQAAIDQLFAKKGLTDLVAELGKRAGAEGATEALQEVIQDVGIAGTTSKEMDYQNLLYNALESGTIGAIVGGSFATPGIVSEHKRLNNAFFSINSEDPSKRGKWSELEEILSVREGRKRMDEIKSQKFKTKADKKELARLRSREYRRKKTTAEVANEYKKDKDGKLLRHSQLGDQAYKAEDSTRWTDLLSLIRNPKRAVQAYRNFANDLVFKKDGKVNYHMANFASLLSGIRVHTGLSFDQDSRQLMTDWFLDIPSKQEMIQALGVNNINEVYSLIQDPDSITNPDIKAKAIELRALFSNTSKKISDELKRRGIFEELDIDHSQLEEGELFLFSNMIDPSQVDDNFREMLKGLSYINDYGTPTPFTDELINKIMNGLERGYLSTTDRRKLFDAGVFSSEESNPFTPYLSQDIFDNSLYYIDNLAKDASLYTNFGKNGVVLGEILDKAQKEGEINEEQKAEMAAMAQDYIDMLTGQYRPITNKRFKWAQENILFVSTITYMDFNFFANMVEAVNGAIGLDATQLWAYISDAARIFFKTTARDISAATHYTTKKTIGKPIGSAQPKRRMDDMRIKRLVYAGILGPKSDIGLLEGINVDSKFYSFFTNLFYKFNLVENQTLAMRGARAGAAWDSIIKMVAILHHQKTVLKGRVTEKGRWARDRLNYYRVDPDVLLDAYAKLKKKGIPEADFMEGKTLEQIFPNDKELVESLRQQYKIGVANFTDEFSVRPEIGSTPKWIEDPSLRLFTQFKRFISHFMANVIPRAWDGYIKNGPPGMTYGTFSIIMGAYGMAMFSQLMKDFLMYGEEAPWLEDDEEDPQWTRTSYWRAAVYSGWMGTGSDIVEAISEYDRNAQYMNPFQNIYDAVVSQSPALNLISDQVLEGTENLPERMAKLTPFLGGIKPTREALANAPSNLAEMLIAG